LISFTNPAGKHRKTTPEKATTRKLSFAVPLRLSLSLFLLLFDVSHEAFVNPQDLPPAPRPSTYTSKTNTHAHTRLFPSPSITTASLPARQTRAYCERRRRPNSPRRTQASVAGSGYRSILRPQAQALLQEIPSRETHDRHAARVRAKNPRVPSISINLFYRYCRCRGRQPVSWTAALA